jgi:hypothetical protein
MTRVSRVVVLLFVLLTTLFGARSALADPVGPTQPRPAAGPDQHSQNMKLLASLPKTGTTNSDLAFWGRLAYHGNYNGFRVIDISAPGTPTCSPTWTAVPDRETSPSGGTSWSGRSTTR